MRFNELKLRYPDRVHHICGASLNVRSEMIRKAWKDSQSVKEEKLKRIVKFVQLEEVADYIVKHNLWDSEERVNETIFVLLAKFCLFRKKESNILSCFQQFSKTLDYTIQRSAITNSG